MPPQREQNPNPSGPELKKAFVLAGHLGLSRDERLEIASVILNRDVTTWKGLTPADSMRLLDAFEGHIYLAYLTLVRRNAKGPHPER